MLWAEFGKGWVGIGVGVGVDEVYFGKTDSSPNFSKIVYRIR
jgi:hypothetical protein